VTNGALNLIKTVQEKRKVSLLIMTRHLTAKQKTTQWGLRPNFRGKWPHNHSVAAGWKSTT
jgi:hypothetical protein